MTHVPETATIRQWLAEPLPREVKTAIERLARTDDVRRVVVLPDVHLAEDVCIGTVIATRRLIYPDAVGGDIGCGMAAIRFECEASVLADEREAARLLAGLYRVVPAIRHSRATAVEQLPEPLASDSLSDPRLEKLKPRDGRVEFATLGRGNHFLEFQADDAGSLWLMVHSGSRAMGQAIRDFHLRSARAGSTGLRSVDAEEASGQAYLADVAWASMYAEKSRRALVGAAAQLVSELFSADADHATFISCHHNQVRRETHSGESLWVHRKGAIPAAIGEPGIIPGSMGTSSYHVEGRGLEDALSSSSHGAGRAMSRSMARRVIRAADLHREMRGVWFDHRLGEALRDEAPSAYKDITAVMRAQGELTRIVRRLRPVLCYKGT